MNPNPIRTLAALALAAGAFALGLTMGQNTEQNHQRREAVSVLVGMGCENAPPSGVVIAYEEDEFPWPCKEVERHRLALLD